ncbi:MAG: methyltransferase dimerization domain-containing protein, partial [bacterium]
MKRSLASQEVQRLADLMAVGSGYSKALLLLAANKVGIFDAVAEKGLSPKQIASRLRLDLEAVTLVVRALTGHGFLKRRGNLFSLPNSLKPFLRRGARLDITSILRHHSYILENWVKLGAILRKGRKKVASPVIGSRDRDRTDAFIRGMANLSRMMGPLV